MLLGTYSTYEDDFRRSPHAGTWSSFVADLQNLIAAAKRIEIGPLNGPSTMDR